jgi:hypothetical protein
MHHRHQILGTVAAVGLTLTAAWSGMTAAQTSDTAAVEETVGASSVYEVVSLTGDLLVWEDFGTQWIPLAKGMCVLTGTLLQSKGESDLVLRRIGAVGQSSGDRALSLKMTVPTMLRIEDRLNRQITLSSFTMQSKNLNRPPQHQFGTDKPKRVVAGLPAAWERLRKMGALMIDVADDSESLITPKNIQRALAMEQKLGTIELSQPSDGAAFVVDKFPTHIPLAWEPLNMLRPVTKVDVYLRGDKDVVNQLAMRTKQRALPLKIPRPGVYKILVTAPELGIQSAEIVVAVEGVGGLTEEAVAKPPR